MNTKRFKTTHDISPSLPYGRLEPQHRDPSKPWPRRLLHVPSMTSFEHKPGNKYNGIKEPRYNAISYTWGRFEDKSETAINIRGVTWKVPGISKSHFTVAEFEKAIHKAADGYQFVWLDVACIDQENDAVKMNEVNKQGAIYGRAKDVYAWMVPWDTRELLTALHTVTNFVESHKSHDEIVSKLEPVGFKVAADLDALCLAFKEISQHAWFTSLWTLQEGYLRRPFFLSRSAEMCFMHAFHNGQHHPNQFPVGLQYLVACSWDTWDELRLKSDRRAISICQSIVDSGLLSMHFLQQLELLYPAALKRYVSLPQDAVYAIMHVFDAWLPSVNEVEELLLRLALVVNKKNPVSYQLFLHQAPVLPEDAWRMSKTTHMPYRFFNPSSTTLLCDITPTARRRPMFAGRMAPLQDVLEYWANVQKERTGSRKLQYEPILMLDATHTATCVCLELQSVPPADPDPDLMEQGDEFTKKIPLRNLADALPFPVPTYRVLLLGSKAFTPGKSTNSFVWVLTYHFGLVVHQVETGEKKPWYRLGIAAWLKWSRKDRLNVVGKGEEDEIKTPYNGWQKIECLIG